MEGVKGLLVGLEGDDFCQMLAEWQGDRIHHYK